MRRLVALAACAIAAASMAAAAPAQDPVKPELGGGPNRDYRELKGGDGEKPRRGAPEPKLPSQATPPGASQGGASTGGGAPQNEDERKATESKEKAKKRPGYKDEAPSPRA
jgi:opacity protein-like surface antigen